MKKVKTGLVLSGGGMRGFAHLGVIKSMNENGIFPDVISGSSVGALVGALYADGKSPDEIFDVFADRKLFAFLQFIFPKQGFLKMTGLYKLLLKTMKAKTFEQLSLPLHIAITNLNEGKCEYISKNKLLPYVMASCSIPIIFQPTVINSITYVDGGVLDNLPVKPIRNICEKIIGVNVNIIRPENNLNKVATIADRCAHLLIQQNIDAKRNQFDLLIEPPEMSRFNLFDISKAKDMMEIGYETSLPLIKDAIAEGML